MVNRSQIALVAAKLGGLRYLIYASSWIGFVHFAIHDLSSCSSTAQNHATIVVPPIVGATKWNDIYIDGKFIHMYMLQGLQQHLLPKFIYLRMKGVGKKAHGIFIL